MARLSEIGWISNKARNRYVAMCWVALFNPLIRGPNQDKWQHSLRYLRHPSFPRFPQAEVWRFLCLHQWFLSNRNS
jgi:hypothetical protein